MALESTNFSKDAISPNCPYNAPCPVKRGQESYSAVVTIFLKKIFTFAPCYPVELSWAGKPHQLGLFLFFLFSPVFLDSIMFSLHHSIDRISPSIRICNPTQVSFPLLLSPLCAPLCLRVSVLNTPIQKKPRYAVIITRPLPPSQPTPIKYEKSKMNDYLCSIKILNKSKI